MLVIGNGRLVTRDPEQPFFENGAVAMDGTTIKKAGTLEEIKKEFPDAEYVDAKGGVIMPAFINTHEHIYSAMARGLSIKGYDPKGFLDILDGMWWTIDRHLTGEQTRQSARATYLDSIKNGVTTVFDHHASFGEIKDSLFAIEDAAKEMGVRTCLCYEVSDRDGMDKARAAVMENASWIKHALADGTDMIAGMMGMHAQFTISDETMELAAANKPAEVGYHIHVAEGIEDLHDCLTRGWSILCSEPQPQGGVQSAAHSPASTSTRTFLRVSASLPWRLWHWYETELEEEKGKNLRLMTQINKDFENSSLPLEIIKANKKLQEVKKCPKPA